jgi:hypothetical protein
VEQTLHYGVIMENKKLFSIRYVMRKEDIMTFVSGLHKVQEQMIEEALAKSNMKDANEVIKFIMEKK